MKSTPITSFLFTILFLSFFASCSDDDDCVPNTQKYTWAENKSIDTHIESIETKKAKLQVGE